MMMRALLLLTCTMAASAAMAQAHRTDTPPPPPHEAGPKIDRAAHLHQGPSTAGILSVEVQPAELKSGNQGRLILRMNHPSKAPITVHLTTEGRAVGLPKQLTIPRGVKEFVLKFRIPKIDKAARINLNVTQDLSGPKKLIARSTAFDVRM